MNRPLAALAILLAVSAMIGCEPSRHADARTSATPKASEDKAAPDRPRPEETDTKTAREAPSTHPDVVCADKTSRPEVDPEKLQFIRLRYRSAGWDDGVREGADRNLLAALARLLRRPAETEGRSVLPAQLRTENDPAPPLVYMTGSGPINLSPAETAALRAYLAAGGTLLADAGSARWGRDFRQLVKILLPERRLVTLDDDAPILRAPFRFENGAPPLWHHDGRKLMGVRKGGRWVVLYHGGDLGDAWEDGHGGLPKPTVRRTYELAANIYTRVCTQPRHDDTEATQRRN